MSDLERSKTINNSNDEEIDISPLFRTCYRQKVLILGLSFLISFIAGLISLFEVPIWRGNFKIVISRTNKENSSSLLNSNILGSLLNTSNLDMNLKTQQFILKSPSVLNPIYEFVKAEKKIDKDNEYLYEDWINDGLRVKLEQGSNVINVSYDDSNKEFIISVLKKISDKYKNYSTRDLEKGTRQQINYLTNQVNILKERSEKSMKKLNNFMIENGFGDLGGIISLEKNNNNQNTDLTSLKLDTQITGSRGLGRNRFKQQFILLENYEAEYLKSSANMKPESKYLIALKIKIDNMRDYLKRPNELLIKLRELERKAMRDELLLNQLENNLSILVLEQAKGQKPWEIISEPTIEKNRISPNRKRKTLNSFIFTFLGASIFAILKEKRTGIIFEDKFLKNKLNCQYLEKIYKDNQFVNDELISNLKKIYEFKIIVASSKMKNDLDSLFSKFEVSYQKLDDYFKKYSSSNFILLIERGKISYSEIENINKYINAFPDQFKGWLLIEE